MVEATQWPLAGQQPEMSVEGTEEARSDPGSIPGISTSTRRGKSLQACG